MDFKNKYLKYKNKYLELKKKQYGSGPNSHKQLDPRIYKYIGTYETREERIAREITKIPPEQGYKIWNSIDEIIEYNYGMGEIDRNNFELVQQRISFLDQIRHNLNLLFGEIFNIMNDMGSELFYIDAIGDGNCFLNCLYIYTIMTSKAALIYDLYSITGIKESNLVNYDDFKRSILFLSDSLLDSKITDLGEEIVEQMKIETRNPDIPAIQTFGEIYANQFNTRIIVIQIDSRYKFIMKSADISPSHPNVETDIMILIQKENIHFGLLIPANNNFDLRIFLFNYLNEHLDLDH